MEIVQIKVNYQRRHGFKEFISNSTKENKKHHFFFFKERLKIKSLLLKAILKIINHIKVSLLQSMGLKINYLEVIHLIIINIHILLIYYLVKILNFLSISLSKGHYGSKNIKTYSLNKKLLKIEIKK